MTTSPSQVTLPAPPEPAGSFSFPVVATIAPVLASVAIWSMTQSPFALLFALLGPVVALASLADSSWQSRRHRRRSLRRFRQEAAEVVGEIDRQHRIELEALRAAHPDLPDLFTREQPGVTWHRRFDGGLRIGRGRAESSLQVSDAAAFRHQPEVVRDAGVAIVERARAIEGAPIIVDAFEGIGFVGPSVVADAAVRACVIRLATALSPADWSIGALAGSRGAADWGWLGWLPHASRSVGAADRATVEFLLVQRSPGSSGGSGGSACFGGERVISLWSVRRLGQLPRRCRTVVELPPPVAVPETDPGPTQPGSSQPDSFEPDSLAPGPFEPVPIPATAGGTVTHGEFVSAEEAAVLAAVIGAAAAAAGMIRESAEPPSRIALSALANPAAPPATGQGLACEVGVTVDGRWSVDLVADGPHAVIGGTTGSGKSELLTSWILAMATRYGPDAVTFLLVDFKGGATFGPIATLPHSVGVITDLDHSAAVRAIESLRAEVLHRERALAVRGIRSIDDLPATGGGVGFPRLVIVVDEFAALAGEHPDLHTVFSDLAARGRSLGIHLILCTQRPAATLRDAILANCTLRVCLRVNDTADSVAVIGTAEAALLPRGERGRALVSVGGDVPVLVQVALASSEDADRVVTTVSMPVRRPWRDPLPAMLSLEGIPAGTTRAGIVFGMVDLPARQAQEPAVWNAVAQGNLLAVGAYGAGKSTLLATLAEGALTSRGAGVERLGGDVEYAWDAVTSQLERIDRGQGAEQLLLIDDVDALVARFGRDHQLEFVDSLTRLLRDGPRLGTSVALSTRSIPSLLASAAAACDTRVVLRMPDRADHVAVGGASRDFDERMPPGGGFWRGDRIQVALGSLPPPARSGIPPAVLFPPGATTAIISSAPQTASALIAADGIRILSVGAGAADQELAVTGVGEHLVLMGDLDSWNAAWAFLPALRARAPLVFHGCSVADFRAITRSRRIPPALDGSDTHVWLLRGDAVERARLAGRTA